MKFKRLFLLSLVGICTGFAFKDPSRDYVAHADIDYSKLSVSEYYEDIGDDLKGTDLLTALNRLNNKARVRQVGYGGMRTFAKYSDADPNGSDRILGFYNNQLIGPDWDSGDTWNREHTWPDSRGGGRVQDDAFMVRPTSTTINSNRGNEIFGENNYDPGEYYPEYRGICARIIFYCAIADTSLTVADTITKYSSSMGKLSDLLKWNLEYQPKDFKNTSTAIKCEIKRNDVIQTRTNGQGNRNPFVDHPEYACKIWGDTNSTTKSICANYNPTPKGDVTSLTVTGTLEKTEYFVGDNFDPTGLSITAKYSSGTSAVVTDSVIWEPTPLTEGTTSVIGTYSTSNASKTITIDGITVKSKELNGISVTGDLTRKIFYDNEAFNPEGLTIFARYNDATTRDITAEVVWPKLKAGMTQIIGSYTEGGVTKYAVVNDIIVNRASAPTAGCGGNVIAMSLTLSVVAFFGVLLLLKKKFLD